MAVRGWVQACEWQRRGSELVADAALDAITITVEDTTDFDDAGGIVSISGQTIAYDDGAIDETDGTILLNTGLAAAATVGDSVFTVSGGQVMRDVVLFVSCGDGDDVEVRVSWEQRDYWPEGDYDDPVQVILSDDLEHVLDAPGRIPQSTELAEARGGYPGTLQDIYDSANAAAEAAADAASNATTALTAANGKNKVIYSLSAPGSTPNTAGDIWFRKDSATQTIIGQWQGLGGTSWQQVTLNDQVIANLDAGKIVAGSAFTNALWVKTNFTLGDAGTNGVIQSYNFAGSPVGVYIDKFGLVAKGGSVAGALITGATITGSMLTTDGSFPITISGAAVSWGGGVYVQYAGGDLAMVNGASAIQIGSGVDIYGTLTLHDTITGAVTASGRVTGDSLAMSAFQTGGTTANTFTDSGGVLFRITSSRRYKYDVETADLDPAVALKLRPTTHRRYDDPEYDEADPSAGRLYLSLIAEEAAEVSPWLAVYDDEGRPDGIDWQAVALHTLATVKDLIARIELLEGTA